VNIADYPARFPGQYTIAASSKWDKTVPAAIEMGAGAYDLTVVGPNRFLRRFTGDTTAAGATAQVKAAYYTGGWGQRPRLMLTLTNNGSGTVAFTVTPEHYSAERPRGYHVRAHSSATYEADPVATSDGWYDVTVTISGDTSWSRRYTGHLETGGPSVTG
jgi:phospholipase C